MRNAIERCHSSSIDEAVVQGELARLLATTPARDLDFLLTSRQDAPGILFRMLHSAQLREAPNLPDVEPE